MNRAALALVLAAACGDDLTPRTQVVMTVAGSGRAPAFGEAPFPSDALREGDHLGRVAGLEAVSPSQAGLIADHLAALDGFGLRTAIQFFVDGAIDPTSVPARTESLADAAFVVDVDPASAELGKVFAMEWRYDEARGVVAGAPVPGVVLREGTRYAAVLTTDLRDAGGRPLAPAPALRELDRAPARWQTTAAAFARLAGAPELAGGTRIAGITVFTTEHATAPLLAARSIMAGLPPPSLAFDDPEIIFFGADRLDALLGVATRATDGPRAGLERWGNDNPTGIAHDHVGLVATGHMTIVRFRGDDTKTNGPEDETFQLGPDGTPRIIDPAQSIPVTFILPATPPPPTGYPVVLLGHGLGAGRHQLLAFAEPLCSQGYALAAIDMEGHGSRYQDLDKANNLAKTIQHFSGDPTLRDGFGDVNGLGTTFAFFEGFLNVAAVRDSIRQSALDQSQLVRLVRRGDLDLSALAGPYGAAPHFDPRKVSYLGESYGTVVGSVLAAIEPDVDLYVLDVPGGGVIDLMLPSSAVIGTLALPLTQSIYAASGTFDRFHPLISIMQGVLDGGDPLSYAPHVLRDRFTIAGSPLGPRSVVAIEATDDEVLPNIGTEALARELGLDVLLPDLATPEGLGEVDTPAHGNVDGQTAVLVQYSPATHGSNWTAEHGTRAYYPGFPKAGDVPFPRLPKPVKIREPIYETLAQVTGILETHRTQAVPTVTCTKPPIADFDDDGVTDADEIAAGRDPYDPKH